MDGEGMTEQDAAFQSVWDISLTNQGIETDTFRIAKAFHGAGWAAGVAHGRAAALAEQETEGQRMSAQAITTMRGKLEMDVGRD